ncbi:MAG: hypothetical protein WHT46_10465, partial [Candidatus Geothermincolales bacterium]
GAGASRLLGCYNGLMNEKTTSIVGWKRRLLAVLLGATGLGTAAFWVLFFTGRIQATETEQDEAFERAFPLADAWMSSLSMLAAWHLWRGEREGEFLGTAAGSSLVFLALMDILYSLENRKYWPLDSDRATMLAIHLWTLGLGSSTLAHLWKTRG